MECRLPSNPVQSRFSRDAKFIPTTSHHHPIPNTQPFTTPLPQSLFRPTTNTPPPRPHVSQTAPLGEAPSGNDVATVTPPRQPVVQGDQVIGLLPSLRLAVPRINRATCIAETRRLHRRTHTGLLVGTPSPAIGGETRSHGAHVSSTSVPPPARYKRAGGMGHRCPPFCRSRPPFSS